MSELQDNEKIVRLHDRTARGQGQDDHPLTQSLKRVGPIPQAPKAPPPDPFAGRRPNWLAVGALTSLSVLCFVGTYLTPPTADDGVRFGAAMAMILGIISLSGALLYRYGREFWVPLK